MTVENTKTYEVQSIRWHTHSSSRAYYTIIIMLRAAAALYPLQQHPGHLIFLRQCRGGKAREFRTWKPAICMFMTLHTLSITAGHHRLAPPVLVDPLPGFHSKPSWSSLATRSLVISGCGRPASSLFLAVRWSLTHLASFGSAGQSRGTWQCPCPGMALKATSLASVAPQPSSFVKTGGGATCYM